jgi:hypothetical protein
MANIKNILNLSFINNSNNNCIIVNEKIYNYNYKFSLINENEIIDVELPLNNIDLINKYKDIIYKNSELATYGYKYEEIYDENFRKAMRLLKNNYIFNLNELNDIKLKIKQKLKCNIKLQHNKINIYQKGGFFKSHVDTPVDNIMGTLVLVLPTYFKGGSLTINNSNYQFNKSDQSEQFDNCINYIAFYGDIPHNVNLVEDGLRITVTYDIINIDPMNEFNINKVKNNIVIIENDINNHENIMEIYKTEIDKFTTLSNDTEKIINENKIKLNDLNKKLKQYNDKEINNKELSDYDNTSNYLNPDMIIKTPYGNMELKFINLAYCCENLYTQCNFKLLKGNDKNIYEEFKLKGFDITMNLFTLIQTSGDCVEWYYQSDDDEYENTIEYCSNKDCKNIAMYYFSDDNYNDYFYCTNCIMTFNDKDIYSFYSDNFNNNYNKYYWLNNIKYTDIDYDDDHIFGNSPGQPCMRYQSYVLYFKLKILT